MLIFSRGDSTTKLEPNLTIPVRLDGQAPVILLYEPAGEEWITVTVRAVDEVDTVLEVLDSEGFRLAYNDDHASDLEIVLSPTDSAVQHVYISEAGVVQVRVNAFNGATEGEVEVTLTVVEPVPFEAEVLSDSETLLTVDLPENRVFHYPLGANPAFYTIQARHLSEVYDAVLLLRSADGEILHENDDHAGGGFHLDVFDAKITDFAAPEREIWLELREFLGRGGKFEILIQARPIP